MSLQWARDRRNEERERDSDFGPEDYFEGAMRNVHRDDGETEFTETMMLVALCLVISILLYIRTRIVERMRRDQGEQPQGRNAPAAQQNGNGLFPGAEDPARNDWAILR